MKSFNQIWQILSQEFKIGKTPMEWQLLLGPEFPILKSCLQATGEIAKHYPCPLQENALDCPRIRKQEGEGGPDVYFGENSNGIRSIKHVEPQ